MKPNQLLFSSVLLSLAFSIVNAPADPLETGFRHPPDSAKPQTWWHWMNGNISKVGITADLEAMKEIGLGGATIVNVDSGIPRGNVPFMSPAWRDCFKFAIQEANRLGLDMTVENCAGWSSSGGPWNTPENAMQHLVFSEVRVIGPTNFTAALPQPPSKLDYYRDIAVLAFLITDGNFKTIPDFAAKLYETGARQQKEVPASLDNDRATHGALQRGDIVNLTAKLMPEGILNWQVPAGEWVIQRFGYTPTGVENHPAPEEGTGLECDKFSKTALDAHWDGFMGEVLKDIGPLAGKTLTTSLIDSYEVGGQNWSREFREQFQKLRGYDPTPYLPTFTGIVVDSPAVSERFLWDVRRTVADLFAENYFGHFAELCRENGLLNAVEPYTGPFDAMQSGKSADVVMGEFWINREHIAYSIKLAASLANIYGKTFVAAESFTARPGDGRWQNDPYSMKALGDQKFCEGLNRFIFHRYAMQPWTNRWPGMTMGQWGFHFERTQTWWEQGKPWIDYLSRCQFLLQQGRAVADIAYFNGESAPVRVRDGVPPLPTGYGYDAVNLDVLMHGASIKNGRLTLASGASYSVLLLPPGDPNMTPPALQCIANLVRDGLALVGARPQFSPSLTDYPECDAQVKKLADELWGPCDGSNVLEHSCGNGRVFWGKPLIEILQSQKLAPDFEFTRTSDATKLLYCHRADGDADIYFVSNQRTEADSVDVTFRVSGKTPELWHADTGVIERAPVWHERNGRTTVRLAFDPAGSMFVIFRAKASGDQIVSAKVNPQWQTLSDARGKLLVKATSDGTAEFQTTDGKPLTAKVANVPAPLKLGGDWTVRFPPNWGAPPFVTLKQLISWTDHADSGVRYFSGTATYESDIEIPADRLSGGRELWLDLGSVKNIAEVALNGEELGVLWKPPFRVDITKAARPGANKLAIKVTNLWPNRLIGDEHLPPDCEWDGKKLKAWPQWLLEGKPSPTGRLTFTTWRQWTKDSPLLESGLLGPVALQTVVLRAIE